MGRTGYIYMKGIGRVWKSEEGGNGRMGGEGEALVSTAEEGKYKHWGRGNVSTGEEEWK